ncbi:hypothetical protein CANARDRAFT_5287 [[Candida] arabinofermentans NRRL YB-2248]|uniref:ATP synthase subunit 4 n=1 Tax=[Candida] arabinofermentans NRRL YB-2248 TaxID=983967 RepID=A0A1E4T8C3_9ASCO|nr:hypothetical protein CANARDRAFT_5287 [[Candida] arabinofermentans NRRL YB-2248]
MLASRLALRASKQALRPATFGIAPIGSRYMSTPVDPKAKATTIIDALPGNSFISKTGILATSAAASIYAISNELYVVNDETILLVTFVGVIGLVSKLLAPMYGDMAKARTESVINILNEARQGHVQAVKDRINQVANLKDVVSTTKALFELSKETAALEAEAFELKQKVSAASEAKSVLDSWVRYEAQVRQLEQKQLAESVISKVNAELANPKFQDKILVQSVEEVEKLFAKK